MTTTDTAALLSKYPIISDQIQRPALAVVLGQLEKTLQAGVGGAVVEFGCYIGTTSLFIRRLLDARQDDRDFHVYDSFAGLPSKSAQDASVAGDEFRAGELSVSKKQFLHEFQKSHLQPPVVHKAWFDDLTADDLPDSIAFAFLDGDFYASILTSLKLVVPRLRPGGCIAIDDYRRDKLPGVERAVHDYYQGRPPQITTAHNIGVILNP